MTIVRLPPDSVPASPWLLRGAPGPGKLLVFGFHYAGTGAASSYQDWLKQLGEGLRCPIQPPGLTAPYSFYRARGESETTRGGSPVTRVGPD